MTLKRLIDIFLSILGLLVLSPLFVVVALIIWLSDRHDPLYWSERVGKDNRIFLMPKFRSMKKETPQVATHLLKTPENYYLRVGGFIRKSSLDELPQLWSILKGDMSFVGPRPALFNQHDLVKLRTSKRIHEIVPGVTGWAQVNGRDSVSIPQKVELDEYYLKNMSLGLDFKIIFMTIGNVLFSRGVSH